MKSAGTITLLAIILGCGVWLFYYQKSQPKAGDPVMHKAPLACPVCGKSWVGDITTEPAMCKFCKKPTAWTAMQCRNPKCKAIVPYVHDKPPEPGKPPLVCPKCNGTAFGQPPPDALSEH